MHIAFWSPAWPLETFQNGIVTYVHWMKRGLEARGHRVSVFTGEVAGVAVPSDVHVVKLGAKARLLRAVKHRGADPGSETLDYSRWIADAIMRVHRRDAIDLIEMEESFGWFADVAARTRIPLVVKLHGPAFLSMVEDESQTPFAQLKIAREGEALRGARAILTPCASTLRETVDRYGLKPSLCRLIGNPLTMDPETPVWRLERCDPETVLFVGRFDLRKGGDLVLRAFRLCLQKRPTLRLIFVGPDVGLPTPEGAQVHFEEFCREIFPGELRERVVYLGRQPNKEIAKIRVSAMVTVIASRWENLGYTLLEAMYQGCPVVTSDAGGSSESVVDGVSALLAKTGDAISLAEKLMFVIENPIRAKGLGFEARQRILTDYSSDAVAEASLKFYTEALNASVSG